LQADVVVASANWSCPGGFIRKVFGMMTKGVKGIKNAPPFNQASGGNMGREHNKIKHLIKRPSNDNRE